jgi:hypothetical protein
MYQLHGSSHSICAMKYISSIECVQVPDQIKEILYNNSNKISYVELYSF